MRHSVILSMAFLLCCCDDEPGDDDDVQGDGDADADGGNTCTAFTSLEGTATGLEACGWESHADYYRLEPTECVTTVEEGMICGPTEACPLDIGGGNVQACTEGELCLYAPSLGCECHRPCAHDDDCGEGFACVCQGTAVLGRSSYETRVSRCVEALCQGDRDCPGGRCVVAVDGCGNPEILACRDDADACATHDDCADGRCGRERASWKCADWWSCE